MFCGLNGATATPRCFVFGTHQRALACVDVAPCTMSVGVFSLNCASVRVEWNRIRVLYLMPLLVFLKLTPRGRKNAAPISLLQFRLESLFLELLFVVVLMLTTTFLAMVAAILLLGEPPFSSACRFRPLFHTELAAPWPPVLTRGRPRRWFLAVRTAIALAVCPDGVLSWTPYCSTWLGARLTEHGEAVAAPLAKKLMKRAGVSATVSRSTSHEGRGRATVSVKMRPYPALFCFHRGRGAAGLLTSMRCGVIAPIASWRPAAHDDANCPARSGATCVLPDARSAQVGAARRRRDVHAGPVMAVGAGALGGSASRPSPAKRRTSQAVVRRPKLRHPRRSASGEELWLAIAVHWRYLRSSMRTADACAKPRDATTFRWKLASVDGH